jgi:hypothetical protein
MSEDFIAIIREKSARYQEWLSIMGTNEFPLKSPIPEWASAPGIEAALFLQIDLALLTGEQRARLVKHLALKFSIDSREVDQSLDAEGCPILDEDVMVIIRNPQKWV